MSSQPSYVGEYAVSDPTRTSVECRTRTKKEYKIEKNYTKMNCKARIVKCAPFVSIKLIAGHFSNLNINDKAFCCAVSHTH